MYCFINMAILVVELDSDTLPISEGGKMVCGANGDMTASVHDSAVAAVLRHLLFHLRTMLSPCSLLSTVHRSCNSQTLHARGFKGL